MTSSVLFGKRSQASAGQMGATGLLPTRFGDQFRQEQAAHFERSKGLLIYSANTPSQAIEEGAQDRVSLFVQLVSRHGGYARFAKPGANTQLSSGLGQASRSLDI